MVTRYKSLAAEIAADDGNVMQASIIECANDAVQTISAIETATLNAYWKLSQDVQDNRFEEAIPSLEKLGYLAVAIKSLHRAVDDFKKVTGAS